MEHKQAVKSAKAGLTLPDGSSKGSGKLRKAKKAKVKAKEAKIKAKKPRQNPRKPKEQPRCPKTP